MSSFGKCITACFLGVEDLNQREDEDVSYRILLSALSSIGASPVNLSSEPLKEFTVRIEQRSAPRQLQFLSLDFTTPIHNNINRHHVQ